MKSIKDIKNMLKAASEQLELAASALDTVKRDGSELRSLRDEAASLIENIDIAIRYNESNVDEVRRIKESVEDACIVVSTAVQDMETQAEIMMKEVTVQTIMNTNTGQFTFRIVDPKAATLASFDGPPTAVGTPDNGSTGVEQAA